MSIFYNKIQRANPRNREQQKWYPAVNSLGLVHTKEVAKQMSDETTLNPKEIEVALYELAKVSKRLLTSGYTVQIDGFGTFYPTFTATGADTEAAATASNVQKVNIRFRPHAELKAAIEGAELKPKP
jgi:predicted histone-like DNA-binding protein